MKKIIVIIILLGILAAGSVGYFLLKRPSTMRFQGKVANVNYGCGGDGSCGIITDNGCAIEMVKGGFSQSLVMGEVTGITFDNAKNKQKYIGKKVEVYAQKTDETGLFFGPGYGPGNEQEPKCRLTIDGSKKYYVRVSDN